MISNYNMDCTLVYSISQLHASCGNRLRYSELCRLACTDDHITSISLCCCFCPIPPWQCCQNVCKCPIITPELRIAIYRYFERTQDNIGIIRKWEVDETYGE